MTAPKPTPHPTARPPLPARAATTLQATAASALGTATVVAWAATLAVAAAAGWAARGPVASDRVASSPAAAVAPPTVAIDLQPPLIAVASDGRATLRVEQQPLDWVLEQIALQSGRPELAGITAAATTSAAPAARPGSHQSGDAACATPTRADPGSLLFTIEHGADDARAEALLQAQAGGLKLPEPLVRSLLETSASERVRLAALDSWLAMRSGDARAERAALEAALVMPSMAVQQEARQRLDDLDEIERMDAEAARRRSP